MSPSQWVRFQWVMLRARWKARLARRERRLAAPAENPGDTESAAHWLFYGLSYFFRPAIRTFGDLRR